MPTNSLLPISVLTTSKNEFSKIDIWFDSFINMDYLPNELVVVDSNSTDGTYIYLDEVIKPRLKKLNIRFKIISLDCNISKGRNVAVNSSTNQFLAFTDFGVVFKSDWLLQLYNGLQENDYVGGAYCYIGDTNAQKTYIRLFNPNISLLKSTYFLPSSRSFAIRKNVIIDAGMYNENYNIGEDTELMLRLFETKYKYSLIENALVYWYPRDTYIKILKQHFIYSYWDGKIGQNLFRPYQFIYLFIYLTPYFFVFNPQLFFILIVSTRILMFFRLHKRTNSIPNIKDLLIYNLLILISNIGLLTGLLVKNLNYKN